MSVTADIPGLDEIDLTELVNPRRFADGYPQEVWAALREHSPVHWVELPGYKPFWALTRHAEMRHVLTHPELFSCAGRLILASIAQEEKEAAVGSGGNTLLNTDPPIHREYRNMAAPYFRPRVLRDVEDRVRQISRDLLDRYSSEGEWVELDFATDVASWHPLKMISEVLGAEESDEPTILAIANEIFGSSDPEFARDPTELFTEAFEFLARLVAEKRAHPKDDLASVLSAGSLNGSPLED